MDAHGGAMNEVEQQHAPEAERLEKPTDDDIEQILSLSFDALDERNNLDTRHDRRVESSRGKLYREFLKSGKHGALFVVRESGRIVGFLALKTDVPSQEGHVERLRTRWKDRSQVGVAQKLLTAAEHYLRESPRGVTEGILRAEHPSEHLRTAARLGHLSHFFEFQEAPTAANDDEPGASLSRAA